MRLELEGISAGYGASTVLRNVNLTVPDGTVVCLLGPNGAGKSTTLGVASGLLHPRQGRVLLDDDDVTTVSAHRRVSSGLCHITEVGSTFPGLSVADNLRMFTPAGHDDAMDRVIAAFPRLGQRLHQQAGTMSGGEQRMLALARAYAQDAKTVLVDEVSLGLAPMVVDEIFEHLRGMAANGTSLLIVEQYVSKVLEIADLVYVLVRGQIEFCGERAEVDEGDLVGRYLGAVVESGAST